MRKAILLLAVSSAVLFGISFARAAPAPWGMALNLETKECAGFWPGDEFVAYHLPEGWKSYFPKYNIETNKSSLVTDIGECDFKIQEEEKCCQQLGCKFVSDNIGKGQKTILRDREAFEKELELHRKYGKYSYLMPVVLLGGLAVVLFGIIGIILLIIWLIRKSKTPPR